MDPDRHRCEHPAVDCGAEECADGCGEGNCGVGVGDGSDRVEREETLDGGVRVDGEERDGALWRGDERKGCAGYEPRRDRFESSWAPWGMSGSERRSRSPERKEFSIRRSDAGVVLDNEITNFSDLPPIHAPPLAAVAPIDAVAVEEPAFRVGVGLTNLGNTCFLNSVLQCLFRTAPLRQGLCMVNHYSPCFEEFCLICCMRELMLHTFTSFNEIAPYSIAANLRYFSPDFVRYRQEDAHEFLQCLLDKLEKYLIFPSSPFSATASRNLVKQVFGGSLVSRLRCSECNHVSCTPEDLIDFSLEIDDVNTLEGALDSFTTLEKIEDIKLTCDGCKEKVSMEKQFAVDQAPLVASFHLKRFKNDGITVEKIAKHIDYPLSLNLHPYTVGHPEHCADLMYDLYAVIVHDGFSSDSGHYYCFVRTSPSTWHEFDDSTVTRVSESHVLSREAYILFYAKQGTSWFSNYNDVQGLYHSVAPKYSPNSVLDKANQSSESDSSTENLTMCDVQVNRHKECSEDAYQPPFIGPQLLKSEARVLNYGHGESCNFVDKTEDDDKNDVDMEDSSFNFDMLLNDKDKENRKEADATINSLLNFDLIKDEVFNDKKEMADKNGSSISSGEKIEATTAQTCTISSLTNEEYAPSSSSVHEVGNYRNKQTTTLDEKPTKSPNCQAGSSGSPGVTKNNTINSGRNTTKPTSCQADLIGSPEATKVLKPTHRKRSPEKPVDDPRRRQVLKTLKRTNMPMARASKFLAAISGSPTKKNKKSHFSPGNKLSPRTACRKNQNRVVSPSVRSAIFR